MYSFELLTHGYDFLCAKAHNHTKIEVTSTILRDKIYPLGDQITSIMIHKHQRE